MPETDRAGLCRWRHNAWLDAGVLAGSRMGHFDPTNSLVGNRNLIRVAVAWDQRNALPLSGTFIGPASSFRSMDVTVSVIEEPGGVRQAVPLPT